MARESFLAADAGQFTYMHSSHVMVKELHPVLYLLRTDAAVALTRCPRAHTHKMKEHVLRLNQGKVLLHMQ